MGQLFLALAERAARVFYRLRELGEDVPSEGPLLLVGNHPNGLVDPVLVAARTPRRVRFLAKEPLFRMPLLGRMVRGAGALPVYRPQDGADASQNDRTFEAVFDALGASEVVCLFPEGKSHDEPTLQRLKTGTARMALGAEARHDFQLGVRIVPVGLSYRHKASFRSAAASWVGEPVSCTDLRELHERDAWAAVEELTERVARALSAVSLQLERWEDLALLELAERLMARRAWAGLEADASRVERIQALARGFAHLREHEPERAHRLAERLAGFRDRLSTLGIPVDDLGARYTPGGLARFALGNVLRLAVGLPLALAGGLYWSPPYLAARRIARSERYDRDVVATVGLLAALVFFPLWWLLGAGLLGWSVGWMGALALLLAAPPLGLFAIAFSERWLEASEDAAVFFRLLRMGELRARLVRRRDELAGEIESAATELELLLEPSS